MFIRTQLVHSLNAFSSRQVFSDDERGIAEPQYIRKIVLYHAGAPPTVFTKVNYRRPYLPRYLPLPRKQDRLGSSCPTNPTTGFLPNVAYSSQTTHRCIDTKPAGYS